MKKIGMLVAVELYAALGQYGQPKETLEYPGYSVLVYQTEAYTLYVLKSGAGQIYASAAVQFLISVLGVELILNYGVVGGLTPEMAQARTCLVERVVHYDFDTSAVDDCEVGRYLDYPTVYLPATPELVEKALAAEPSLQPVTCASGDKFIADPAKKAQLHTDFGADICEMEAAAVVLICNRNRIPCLLIKTVADSLSGGKEEYWAAVRETAALCLTIADRVIKELSV